MLKHRVIPVLLYDGSYCVVTEQFKTPARRVGPITQYVENMANRNIDELILIDIYATKQGRRPDFKRVKEFTNKLMCPVTYGGGIGSIDDISKLIKDCGVDKVAIKTNFNLIKEAANKFGSQAVVYSMDLYPHHSSGEYFVHGMTKAILPAYCAELMRNEGAGELLLTAMHKQGLMQGYSNVISQINVKIPIIANGGCGSIEDMVNALKMGADAVAAGTVFCLRSLTPQEAARGLKEAGLPARVV